MAEDTTTRMNLQHDVTVNGKTYKAGRGVEVPKAQAEDLERIDYEHGQYEQSLIRSRTYENQVRV